MFASVVAVVAPTTAAVGVGWVIATIKRLLPARPIPWLLVVAALPVTRGVFQPVAGDSLIFRPQAFVVVVVALVAAMALAALLVQPVGLTQVPAGEMVVLAAAVEVLAAAAVPGGTQVTAAAVQALARVLAQGQAAVVAVVTIVVVVVGLVYLGKVPTE